MSARQVREILTRAAERIDALECEYCCYAMREYDEYPQAWGKANDYFRDLFSPYRRAEGAAEFWNEFATPERQRLRVLALLFAAASYEEP